MASQLTFGGIGTALRVRNRNQRHLRIGLIERQGIGQIETSVQCRETFVGKIVEQGLRQQVHVKMDDVEIIGAAAHLAQHARVLPR